MEDVAPARAWLPVALYCLAIFAASSVTGRAMPATGFWRFDKLLHFGEYAVLGVLACRALALGPPRLTLWAAALAAAALAAAYGASDEWHQGFVPGRDPSGLDLLADAAGAAAGAAALALIRRARGAHGDHP